MARPAYDVLIRNGRLIDGTGTPWYRGDVAVQDGHIAAVGPLTGASAALNLDAAGKVICPGFVDAHVHGDLALFTDPAHEAAIRQGVTSYVVGQDGVAMAPATPATLEYMCRYTAGFSGGAEWLNSRHDVPAWSSMAEYLDRFTGRTSLNAVCLVPNGNVRMEILGLDTRAPTERELAEMARLVSTAMEEGAVGLSSGLDYIPSRYADTDELIGLCRAIAPFGGVYVTHMRRYDPDGVAGSMEEVFRIGREAGCAVHISHFNSQADLVLPLVDRARSDGIDVTFDLYCYLFGSSIMGMYCLPPWVQEGGPEPTLARLADPAVRQRLRDWFEAPRHPLETIRISYIGVPELKHLEGLTLEEAARRSGHGEGKQALGDLVIDLLRKSKLAAGVVTPHKQRDQSDIDKLMRHPTMMGGSDGIYTGSRPHPRGCGCYARYLGHHVRNGTWDLETAVQRLAALPARRFGLRDRGLLTAGQAADVIVFDPDAVADRATFEDGQQLAEGMRHVLINGVPVLRDGQRTEARPGRGLRRR
jgi:N-acyl-D-amino-acid deacylase